ncbi:MAG: hypothetical protein AAGK02_06515 [Pseudomonadota bacterium]
MLWIKLLAAICSVTCFAIGTVRLTFIIPADGNGDLAAVTQLCDQGALLRHESFSQERVGSQAQYSYRGGD